MRVPARYAGTQAKMHSEAKKHGADARASAPKPPPKPKRVEGQDNGQTFAAAAFGWNSGAFFSKLHRNGGSTPSCRRYA